MRRNGPEILPGLARRPYSLSAELYTPVGVGERARFLGEGGGGQHHVGITRRLSEEDVLDHQVLELGQRLAGVVQVRIRHRRVLAHDVHAVQLAVVHRVHDRHHGQTRFGVEFRAPQLLEIGVRLRIVDPLVIREYHRYQSYVGSPLDVVLAPQRAQPRARAAALAGHQRQGDEAGGIVGAVDVP
jgi:hypothetical protein